MEQVLSIRGFSDLSDLTKQIILNSIKNDEIAISIDDLNKILFDQSFKIQLFKKIFDLFQKSSVELEYPSNNFQQNLIKVTNLKKNEIKKLQITLIISSFAGLTLENYDYTNVDSVIIKDTVDSIPSLVFKTCSSLKNVTIPESVTHIGEGSFFDCSSLKEINIPSSVTSIEDWTFYSCSELKLKIPNSITSIGACAFSECKSIMILEIPSSVTSIGSLAFFNCPYLCFLSIPSSVTNIGEGAFGGCPLAGLVQIPSRFELENIGISSNVKVIRI